MVIVFHSVLALKLRLIDGAIIPSVNGSIVVPVPGSLAHLIGILVVLEPVVNVPTEIGTILAYDPKLLVANAELKASVVDIGSSELVLGQKQLLT